MCVADASDERRRQKLDMLEPYQIMPKSVSSENCDISLFDVAVLGGSTTHVCVFGMGSMALVWLVPFDGDMLLLALASTHTRLSLCRKMGPWFAIGWRVADARKSGGVARNCGIDVFDVGLPCVPVGTRILCPNIGASAACQTVR